MKAGFYDAHAGDRPHRQGGPQYGAYLGIITQRPSELDQTIPSQWHLLCHAAVEHQGPGHHRRRIQQRRPEHHIAFLPSISNREYRLWRGSLFADAFL
ncbi:MAG: hypothetical protein M9908_06630 [Phyllobacteriaceae bacterium]|nr:hypothetical protein [Phyllobacteriaceae bacterium]